MADVQLGALGTSPAPLAYTVPGAQEIILKALFATFDGTAAGGAFLPCIRILAPGGKVVGEYITDASVAAGSSAEVSFAPFLRGAASSSPTGFTISWAFMQRTSVLVHDFVATTTGVDFDLANGHVSGFTSDASVIDVGVAVGGGLHGITLKSEGQYLWAASGVGSPAGVPAANSTAAVRTSWDNGDCWACNYVSPFLTGPGAAVTQTQPFIIEQFNLKAGGTAPPQLSTVFLSQNSGGDCTFGQVTFAVIHYSPTGTLDFT